MAANDPDRSKRFILGVLAIVGIVLAIVGWYNWAS